MAENTGDGNESGNRKPFFSFTEDGGISGDNVSGASKNSGAIDPASLAGNASGDTGTDSGKRKRGRPKGSGTKAGAGTQKAPLDIKFVEFALFGIHTMLASSMNTPELALNEDETAKLAGAINNVAQYYPVVIDPKMQAWMGLFMVAGSLYVPRVISIYARANTEPVEEQQPVFKGPRAV